MSKIHTPGPWKAREPHPVNHMAAIDAVGPVAAVIASVLDADVYVGNAALIAAAPDLLAACERALADASEPDGVVHVKVLEAMQSAIAKAKGGAA